MTTGSEPVRVLVPDVQGADVLATLMIETTAMRQQKYLDPPGSRWMTYTRRADALTARRTAPSRRLHMPTAVTVARYALDATVLPLVQDTLPFAERVRRAVIRHRMPQSHSEVLVGKTAEGTPLAEHGHAHLATDEDGDGRLDHMTIYAPSGFDVDDVTALGRLRRIFQSGNRPEVQIILIGLGTREQFAANVSLLAAARTWISVTPFALPRFASRGAGKPPRPRDLPEAQVRRELRVRSLPEPVALQSVTAYAAPGRPPARWLEFHTRRFNGETGYGLAGFELAFTEDVVGPITLGFACHFGLGLFMPTAS
jgi:CRISPR-associated protein Csb2